MNGNINSYDPVVVLFPGLPLGKKFKITPLTWEDTPAAQIELFGCTNRGISLFINNMSFIEFYSNVYFEIII